VLELNAQETASGLAAEVHAVRLLPDELFVSSAEDDWTAVRVEGDPADRWGAIPLDEAPLAVGDRVNIIQHPNGDLKQLSFFHNTVVFVGQGRAQYLTDTLPGSSGAPVFDRDWNLVALHHSGGWIREPGAQSGQTFLRNEGILVGAVRRGLAERGVAFGA
jgi:hypothetical protein